MKYQYIPLEKKIFAVNLRREHPKWSFTTLQQRVGKCLTRLDELTRWRKDIISGGTQYDKLKAIKIWTNDRFQEARINNAPVTTRDLQEWAMQGATQHLNANFSFMASISWVNNFKKDHRIRQRRVTKYVKPVEQRSMEATQSASENFQSELQSVTSSFDKDFVINTDQMGCEYRSNIFRTLDNVGTKTVNVYIGDLNKITHSYTAQYSITASGKLLPKVFLCMQEVSGQFGPNVLKNIENLLTIYTNVFITCSRSGKLTKSIFKTYLSNVLKEYVEEKEFVLVLDTWSGQKDASLFENFSDEAGKSSCTLKYIPAGCTPYCQPLDTYLHRQIKFFIKKLQNATYLIENQRQLSSREDAIKIHAIVHRQLCAPIFKNMIEYSWYSAKLITERDIFMNVKEVCFSKTLNSKCQCESLIFIQCSWCRDGFCFTCFYDQCHPFHCQMYFVNIFG